MPISTIGTDGLSTSPTLTTPKATTTIGVGNATPAASGAGITFPATQSASSDANTLDDYEEGTWTPTWNGGTISTISQNRYVKVGRVVTVQLDVTLGSSALSAASAITLPFPNVDSYGGGSLSYTTYSAGVLNIDAQGSGVAFRSQNNSILTCANVSATRWIFNITYITTA